MEQNDSNDIFPISDKLRGTSHSLIENEEAYQFCDLATTSSSNDNSSSSTQSSDSLYFIPEYPGLWRPSTNNWNKNLSKKYNVGKEIQITTMINEAQVGHTEKKRYFKSNPNIKK